ncbi:MAG: response regulator, partial [Deltaproteobacteria bacterium]|nr:response regulator [Deltaproteobacteria bacterium]
LDVMLPKVDGYTLCKKIKDDDSFKHIPIIMISARCQKSDIELGNEAGADEYMLKPYDPLELLQVIEKYLI